MGDASFQAVGDPSQVTNTNPMTGNVYNFLQQLAGGQGYTGQIEGLNGITPQIQNISSQLTSPYAGNRLALANQMAAQNQRNTAAQFANLGGAVNTGGFLEAMIQGGAQPLMQATTDIAQMGTGISNGLLNGMMGMGSQGISGFTGYGAPEWWQPTYQERGTGAGVGGGIGALGGGILGALFGGPAGASTGAAIGGSAGSGIGDLFRF